MADASEALNDSLKENIEGELSSSSDSDIDRPSSVSIVKKKSLYILLGGGKSADLFLWRNKHISATVLAGVTLIWILFEWLDCYFLTLSSQLLMLSLALLFFWLNASSLTRKSPPKIPIIQFKEDVIVTGALLLTDEANRSIAHLREVSLGRDWKKFLKVIAELWTLSIIGSWCSAITLLYIAFLMSHTLPVLYERYQDHVDCFADRLFMEVREQYNVLDKKILKKLPSFPLKDNKHH